MFASYAYQTKVHIYPMFTIFHIYAMFFKKISRILYYIRRHEGVHTGWESYQCTQCQMPFVQDRALKVTSEHMLERSPTSVTSVICHLSTWWFEKPSEKTHYGIKAFCFVYSLYHFAKRESFPIYIKSPIWLMS